jgi:endoglucanase
MFMRHTLVVVASGIVTVAGCDVGDTSTTKGTTGSGGAGGQSTTAGTGTGAGEATTSASAGPGTTGPSSSSGATTTSSASSSSTTSSGTPTAGLQVQGNKLVDGGKTVRLLGVDHSGTEFQCIHGSGVFDTGAGIPDQTFVSNMMAWHINTVRVPLNEDCWLGINGAPSQYSGAAYTGAIASYVSLLRKNGLYVIVDLHWNAGGTNQATGQQEMADSDHAPAFWTSVATMFKDDLGIVFDLYNEPHDIAWSCWLNGGCTVSGWPAAGMNQLITAVRSTGAMNVVMAGGISYSGDLSEWVANKPTDPTGNLAASFHTYNFSNCATSGCWTSQLANVANEVPLITGEMGENDCDNGSGANHPPGQNYINGYMTWADGAGVSYLGWAWNADFNNCTGPALNSSGNWTGTAPTTPFGADLKAHLASVNP